MPQVGFETTIPVLEGAKTVHALGHAPTVSDTSLLCVLKLNDSLIRIENGLCLKTEDIRDL
jgi:hypothetical protein